MSIKNNKMCDDKFPIFMMPPIANFFSSARILDKFSKQKT